MQSYIDVETIAYATQISVDTVRRRIQRGEYRAITEEGVRGGASGTKHMVALDSLTVEQQIRLMELQQGANRAAMGEFDFVGYRDQYGEEGMRELLKRQAACQRARDLQALPGTDVTAELEAIAADCGISIKSLYRWIAAYRKQGIAGIARSSRKDKGKRRALCLEAERFAAGLYLDAVKRSKSQIYEQLIVERSKRGAEACTMCPYNPASPVRARIKERDLPHFAPCTEPQEGLLIPECRQTLGRALSSIPKGQIDLARRGEKVWKDNYMPTATREKPLVVNDIWFGDNHQFDVFVIGADGTPVRPWLTAWEDAATGCITGWLLCENPNSDTIIESLIRGTMPTLENDMWGYPNMLYIDNGKDYRSRIMEGSGDSKPNGLLCGVIDEKAGMLELLGIKVTHAIPYNAQSKSIERFFGTFEGIWMREVPGWCGGSPDKRPTNFDPQKLAAQGKLWTMAQLEEYLKTVVWPKYHNRPHAGYGGRKPAELYTELPKARTEIPSLNTMRFLALHNAERKVSTQGIKLDNMLYWDDALADYIKETVTIYYGRYDRESITVVKDGRTICEAMRKETMQLIGESEERLDAHMRLQRGALKRAKDANRRAKAIYYGDTIDESKAGGNIAALEYEKAARTKQRTRKAAQEDKESRPADGLGDMFRALGAGVLRKAAHDK